MSSLVEIEEAIVRLPLSQLNELAAWIEQRKLDQSWNANATREPDFSARAREIWGEHPKGKLLSELIDQGRG